MLFDTLLVFAYALVCLLFGLRLVQLSRIGLNFRQKENWIVVTCSAFLLGQAVLAAIWQMIALAGLFTSGVVAIVCLLAVLSGVMLAPQLIRPTLSNLKTEARAWWQESLLWKLTILLAFVPIAIYALHTYMPPQPRGDALAFYMAYPRLIAGTGELSVIPSRFESFARVGIQGEMHYAVMLLFENFRNPELFTWLTALAGTGMLIALAEYAGAGRRSKWILAIFAFTSSAYTVIIWDGKVDTFGAAMGLAAYYWAFRVEGGNWSALALSGLFAGMAIIAKISYAAFLPLTVALIIFWRAFLILRDDLSLRRMALPLVQIGMMLAVFGALPAIPHVIKNTVLFNEPLAPIIAANNEALVEQSWFTPETTNRILISYPFSLTFGNFWAQGGQITPLILAFVPLLFFIQVPDDAQRQTLWQIGLLALIALGIWIIFRATVFAPRYMMSALMLGFVPVAFAADFISRHGRNAHLKRLIPVALSLVLLLSSLQAQFSTSHALDIFLSRADECSYEYTNTDGTCRITRVINSEADEGARVFYLSFYTYWLGADLAQCTIDSGPAQDQAVWDHLISHDIEYLVVDTLTHGSIYDTLMEEMPDWVTLDLFFDESSYLAFRVHIDRETPPTYHCVETSPNIWQVQAIERADEGRETS